MEKEWRRFRTSTLAVWVSVIIDAVILLLYVLCLQAVNGLPADAAPWIGTMLDVISNVLLVGFSVLTTSLLSVPFIEVRSKNDLCSELLLGDVLKTPEIFNVLSPQRKEELLRSLECSTYFDSCVQKEEMFSSIKRKVSGDPQSSGDGKYVKDCFFESCEYDISCTIEGGYIKKHITKTFDLRAYSKTAISNFPLGSSTFEDIQPGDQVMPIVDSLNVDGVQEDVEEAVTTIASLVNSSFDKRSGYGKNVRFYYKKELKLEPDKVTKIMVSYKTAVPDYDVAYSCRMTHPCHKVHFKFRLEGTAARDYSLAVNAFGFWDDGEHSPNNNDMSSVVVDFCDWIFPRDGVSVTLIKKCGPAKLENSCLSGADDISS